MGFLRDPLWQFVGVIVALIAIFVSIVFYLKQRSFKGLVYEIISDTSVLSIEEEVKGKIQVLYNGHPVDDARILVLSMWNYGTTSITPSDYLLPITFDFGKEAEILDTDVLETHPRDLKNEITLTVVSNKLTLKPCLWNKKESLKIKVLLSKFDRTVQATARINGVSQIITKEELPNRKRAKAIEHFLSSTSKVALLSLILLFLIYSLLGFAEWILFKINPLQEDNLSVYLYRLPLYVLIPLGIVGGITGVVFILTLPSALILGLSFWLSGFIKLFRPKKRL